ncbi:hypothetical protein FHS56_001462 [Thermonema lapsum]|uniref:Uncharacterized protein n=1 Tax=Thermonema lapsum TaxID=28195 RepID=A0A846MR65_9BACT|nr:hypothetical protein [Thermonema lapsum]NIK73949.1 hypothetical protein [Thermonema lapsum]
MKYVASLTLFGALLLLSCGSESSKESSSSNTEKESETSVNTAPSTNDDNSDGFVSFKVNDTLVRTNKTTGGDVDEHIGLYNEDTRSLSLGLYGDVPHRPHRGWLNFFIKDFKFEPATYTLSKENFAMFSRYETINAGGEVQFIASSSEVNKGTEMNLTITKIEPDLDSFTGREWLASGTFSAKMLIQEHNPFRRESYQGVTITEGKFEGIRIMGGPKFR